MNNYQISADMKTIKGMTIENLLAAVEELEAENKRIQTEWMMCDRACKMWRNRSEKLKKALVDVTVKTRENIIFEIANNAVENYYDID